MARDSVGGNMTAALTMTAKKRSGPKIGYQVPSYPVTDAGFDTGSYKQFPTEHFLTLAAMSWFRDQYLPDLAMRKQPTASPLQASIEQLKGFRQRWLLTVSSMCCVMKDRPTRTS